MSKFADEERNRSSAFRRAIDAVESMGSIDTIDSLTHDLELQLAADRDTIASLNAAIEQRNATIEMLQLEVERRDIKVTALLGENVAMTRTLRDERARHRDDIARLRMELAEARDDDGE